MSEIRADVAAVRQMLANAARTIPAAVDAALLQAGFVLQAQIQANASGRPGPRVITGNYRRSWSTQRLPGVGVVVGTNAPQARRLEFGFVGVDSLGRRYNQPPYPHVGPAIDQTSDRITALLAAALDRAGV